MGQNQSVLRADNYKPPHYWWPEASSAKKRAYVLSKPVSKVLEATSSLLIPAAHPLSPYSPPDGTPKPRLVYPRKLKYSTRDLPPELCNINTAEGYRHTCNIAFIGAPPSIYPIELLDRAWPTDPRMSYPMPGPREFFMQDEAMSLGTGIVKGVLRRPDFDLTVSMWFVSMERLMAARDGGKSGDADFITAFATAREMADKARQTAAVLRSSRPTQASTDEAMKTFVPIAVGPLSGQSSSPPTPEKRNGVNLPISNASSLKENNPPSTSTKPKSTLAGITRPSSDTKPDFNFNTPPQRPHPVLGVNQPISNASSLKENNRPSTSTEPTSPLTGITHPLSDTKPDFNFNTPPQRPHPVLDSTTLPYNPDRPSQLLSHDFFLNIQEWERGTAARLAATKADDMGEIREEDVGRIVEVVGVRWGIRWDEADDVEVYREMDGQWVEFGLGIIDWRNRLLLMMTWKGATSLGFDDALEAVACEPLCLGALVVAPAEVEGPVVAGADVEDAKAGTPEVGVRSIGAEADGEVKGGSGEAEDSGVELPDAEDSALDLPDAEDSALDPPDAEDSVVESVADVVDKEGVLGSRVGAKVPTFGVAEVVEVEDERLSIEATRREGKAEAGTFGVATAGIEKVGAGTPEAEEARVEKIPDGDAPEIDVPEVGEAIIAASEDEPMIEAPRVEAPKVEASKVEAAKVEAPKVEAPKVEAPKAEEPDADAPETDTPNTDEASSERTRPGTARLGLANVDALSAGMAGSGPGVAGVEASRVDAVDVGGTDVGDSGVGVARTVDAVGDLERDELLEGGVTEVEAAALEAEAAALEAQIAAAEAEAQAEADAGAGAGAGAEWVMWT